jgi:hypothetical protein
MSDKCHAWMYIHMQDARGTQGFGQTGVDPPQQLVRLGPLRLRLRQPLVQGDLCVD